MPILLDRMIRRITREGHLSGFTDEQVLSVLQEAKISLEPLPAMVEIDAPVVIFGDVHGQLRDLLRFFSIIGSPPKNKTLFLGDYVDRCKKSFEVIMLLLCYRIKYPNLIHLLRGNHECSKMNRLYGFYEELRRKRNVYLWKKFQEVFNEMPLCAVVSSRILCMHGGISPDIHGWESLQTLKKPKTPRTCDDGIAVDLMWSDPSMDSCTGFHFNTIRATSYVFGGDTIANICQILDVAMVVRAHEVVKGGHQFMFDQKLLTIFSAPNYCGTDGNAASIMKVSRRMELSFVTLKPRLDTSRLSEEKRLLLEKSSFDINAKSPDPSLSFAAVLAVSVGDVGGARPTTTTEQSLNNDDCLLGPDTVFGNKQAAGKPCSNSPRTTEFIPLVVGNTLNSIKDGFSSVSGETQKSQTMNPKTAASVVPLVRTKNAQKAPVSKLNGILGGDVQLESIQKPHKLTVQPTSKSSSPKKREVAAVAVTYNADDAGDKGNEKAVFGTSTGCSASKATINAATRVKPANETGGKLFPVVSTSNIQCPRQKILTGHQGKTQERTMTFAHHPQNAQKTWQSSTESESSSMSTTTERTEATAKPPFTTTNALSPGVPEEMNVAATKISHRSPKDLKQVIIETGKAPQKP